MSGGTLVKICGLTLPETAKEITAAGVAIDYIGFVFAPSKRRVDAKDAWSIMQSFGVPAPRFAGVFVNPEPDELDRVLRVAPLDAVQLHGEESPDFCRDVKERHPRLEVWKAFGLRGDAAHDETSVVSRLAPYAGVIDAVLLDAWDPHACGGTGTTFRWDVIPAYQRWTDRAGLRLFIAGGLHADNVGQLLAAYRVGGVDVSSGVETEGKKDIEKIREFAERVKGR